VTSNQKGKTVTAIQQRTGSSLLVNKAKGAGNQLGKMRWTINKKRLPKMPAVGKLHISQTGRG